MYEDIEDEYHRLKIHTPTLKENPCLTCIVQFTCQKQCYELNEALKNEAKRILDAYKKMMKESKNEKTVKLLEKP